MKAFLEKWNHHVATPLETLLFLCALVAYAIKCNEVSPAPPHSNTNFTTSIHPQQTTFEVDLTLDWIFLVLNCLVLLPGEMLKPAPGWMKFGINLMACAAFIAAALANLALVSREDKGPHAFSNSYYVGPSLYVAGSAPLVTSAAYQTQKNRGEIPNKDRLMHIMKPLFITAMNLSNLFCGTYEKNQSLNNAILCALFLCLLVANIILLAPKSDKPDNDSHGTDDSYAYLSAFPTA